MSKFLVKVAITYHKELSIFAKDEELAEEKAVEIASAWNGVEDVEVLEVTDA
jgi:hypothetical protein